MSRGRRAARWAVGAVLLAGGVCVVGWWAGAGRLRPAKAPELVRPAERFQRPAALPEAMPVGLKGLPCFECHNVVTVDRSYPDIIFSHRAHLRRGAHCQVCHQAMGHTERIAPEMDTCLECHDGQRADDRCPVCHSQMLAIKPESHDAEFIRTHGKGLKDRAECWSCHEQRYCDECHKLAMPHPAGWRGAPHGKPALAKPAACYQCHEPRYCDNCHKLTMPHPSDFLRTHAAVYKADGSRCAKCHKDEFCYKCHTARNPHAADWTPRHGLAARAAPHGCAVCHKVSYCDECHKLPMPHPDNWLAGHGSALEDSSATCGQCHETQQCQMCHKDRAPTSHVEGFALKHGELATKIEPACILCHGIDFCAACHADYKEAQ